LTIFQLSIVNFRRLVSEWRRLKFVGWENIELLCDHPFKIRPDEFKKWKDWLFIASICQCCRHRLLDFSASQIGG
jgi:hypothetical protein